MTVSIIGCRRNRSCIIHRFISPTRLNFQVNSSTFCLTLPALGHKQVLTSVHFRPTGLQTDDIPVSSSSVDQTSEKESESVLELAHMNGTDSQPPSLDNSSVRTLDSSTGVANNGNNSESIAEKQSTTVLSPIDGSETESMKLKTKDDEPVHTSKNGSAATSPTDVMHSARDRFDSFWNKSTFNGKESSM